MIQSLNHLDFAGLEVDDLQVSTYKAESKYPPVNQVAGCFTGKMTVTVEFSPHTKPINQSVAIAAAGPGARIRSQLPWSESIEKITFDKNVSQTFQSRAGQSCPGLIVSFYSGEFVYKAI